MRGLDRRRVPVHRRRARAHRPVGRRGRPPHRVLRRPTSARRTTSSASRSSRAASCCRPTRCASGRRASSRAEPWGREQWERLAEGADVRRHGVVAAVAHRGRARAARPRRRRRRRSLLVEPRRMRDRAAELLDEEADLAAHAGADVGRADAARTTSSPRLHLPFDRLLTHTDAPAWTITTAPEGPDTTAVARQRVGPGDRRRRPPGEAAPRAAGRRLPRRRRRRRQGLGRSHHASCSPTKGVALPLVEHGDASDRRAEASSSSRSSAASSCRRVKLAVLAESDVTGRRRAHRRPRPRRSRTAPASSTTSSPATTSSTTSTASPATAAW